MTTKKYKEILMGKDVLDHNTLDVTLKYFNTKKQFNKAEVVQRILNNNKIEKPPLHNNAGEISTNYYRIDPNDLDFERIIIFFINYHINFTEKEGVTTPMSLMYASIVDKWNAIDRELK
jgi:hypothetical protein